MPRHLHVDLFIYPGAMAGTVLSLIDLFRTANMMVRVRQAQADALVSWRLLDVNAKPLLPGSGLFDEFLSDGLGDGPVPANSVQATFVPPLHAHNIPAVREAAARWTGITAYLGAALDQGQHVATLGSGSWLLANSGRLNGLSITLPWFYLGGFRSDFPEVGLAPEHSYLADGPVLTVSGMDAVASLGQGLVALVAGDELNQAFDNAFRHNPERQRMTAQAAAREHIPSTRDSVLARAIDWLHAHLERPYRLEDLAHAAATSPRTLLRHFRQVLGMTPLDYLHRLRCKRARILLEITLDSVPTIAQACGYADPAAFRRIFARCEGMTPSQHRDRYALRASRERWKVEMGSSHS
ncbi:MAG TPA: helix-turn-helix domain-containing protein [Burkholderiaceae bacterium]|nr:helix-turn-helix domain-containing protein [Burkholderiaceae bacterium]